MPTPTRGLQEGPRLFCGCLWALAGVVAAASSFAQAGPASPAAASSVGPVVAPAEARSPDYGTQQRTYVRISGWDFFPLSGGYNSIGMRRYPIDGELAAALHLPGGAIIDYLELDFCDYLDPQDIHLYLTDCGPLGTNCNTVTNINSYAAPGCSAISTSGINYTVNNVGGSLGLTAIFDAVNDPNLSLTGAIVGYLLQVSPPPAAADFTDVPTSHPFFQFIEALYHSGITAGCGGGNYCPDAPLTRGQMAVFLAKALGLQFH